MADLSTPLLDTVVNKLADPTLDCRLLANSNATIEYSSTTDGNATAEIAQSTSSPSEEPRPPSQAPIIIQPSIRPSSAPIVVPSDLSTSSESPSTIPSQYPTVPSESDIYETQQFTIFPTSSGSVETPGLSSATPTSVLTSRPSRIRPIRTLSPSRLPSLSPAVLHTESPVMQLSVTQEPSSEQYPNEPSLPPTEHSPILLTTQPSLTSETDTFNSDLSPVFDDRPASTTLTGSIENSGNNTHQTQTTADSQAGAPSIPDENVPYYWSSTSDISSTEYVPNSGLPQDFSFDGPFISVELFLKDHPGDIGWQLLRPDGTSVVEKPVGSYSSLEPDTVVYEFIPIQPLTSSRSIVGDELQWTIINVRGMGLNGGHWNMFSAAPTEGTLLATGDDFGYTDTVWLLVSNEGHISLRDIGLNQQPPESIPSTSVSVDAMQSQDSTDAVNDSLHEKANESLGPNNVQNPQPTTKKRPVLTPSLALIVAVAVVAGICLLFLAFRNARDYYGGNGEVVDEWNIEEPPDEDFSEDNYYPESEQDIMYDEDHSESIDPSGSFDSYEENNTTDSRLDELPKEKRSRAYSGRDEATDAFENEGLSHHLSLDTFGEILSMDAAARTQFFHDSDVNENFGMSNDSVDNIYDLVREQIRENRSESNDPNRGQRRRHSIL